MRECWNLILSDLDRLAKNGSFSIIKYLITNASFKITFWFRIGTQLKKSKNPFMKILYLLVFILHKHYEYLTGIMLPIGMDVGRGLKFAHFSGIIINPDTIIGNNCTIFQCVTIGDMRGKGGGIIGDNVVIFAGAKLIGNIKIGNNVVIGANAVVVKDIPDNAVVVGVPSHIINYRGAEISEMYRH